MAENGNNKAREKDRSSFKVVVGDGNRNAKVEYRGTLEGAVNEAINFYLEQFEKAGLNGARVIVYKVVKKGFEVTMPTNSVDEFVRESVLKYQETKFT